MAIFSQVRRIVRANSRSMIIVMISFFVLLVGCFMPAVAITATSPFSSPAYSLVKQTNQPDSGEENTAPEGPTSAEKWALFGAVVAALGGIIALLNALLTYLRTLRERKTQVMTDTLPVTQLSLGLDPQGEDQGDAEKRRTQRNEQGWGWFWTGLAFFVFPFQLLFTVLPSFFGGLGLLGS